MRQAITNYLTGESMQLKFLLADISQHYNLPQEYYKYLGEMGSYACNIWDEDCEDNDCAFLSKLRWYNKLLGKPKDKTIFEIGYGSGEMASYFHAMSNKVSGCNVSKSQVDYARTINDRVDYQHGDWADATGQYDIVMSDGCLVHQIGRFEEWFPKNYELTKDGGVCLMKEMHFTRESGIGEKNCRDIGETFAHSGDYRTLDKSIAEAKKAGFKSIETHNIPIENYIKTMTEWLRLMDKYRDELEAIDARRWALDYKAWSTYIRLMKLDLFRVDVMICRK